MATTIQPKISTSKRRVTTLALWTIFIAFAVLGLKAVAWMMTGSVALYSDALESTVNVIAAFAAFWAIRVSHKPADDDHPFGHHKAEYFSAVLEGVLIVLAIWEGTVLAYHLPAIVLPSPWSVAATLSELVRTPAFWRCAS